MIGILEHRDGRGDVGEELAQVVIVAAALLDVIDPDADLNALVAAEMSRLKDPHPHTTQGRTP